MFFLLLNVTKSMCVTLTTCFNFQDIGQTPVGADMCPRFHIHEGDKILVPSGTKKTVTLYGQNIRDFMMDIRCFFNFGQGKDVQARVTSSGPGQTNIECEAVTVSTELFPLNTHRSANLDF